jgi:segregation and condensation protein A
MVLLPDTDRHITTELSPHALTELGIEMLIDLAQRGDIDPWDVRVIDVIDNHLSRIPQQVAALATDKQANLSLSGQAFLWAAMLVLLKANSLENEPVAEELLEEMAGDELTEERGLPPHLEKHIRRRLTAAPMQRRPVTLQDLIEQLRSIASRMSDRPIKQRKVRHANLSASKAAKAIAELAHGENLTEMAEQLEEFLQAADLDWIDLEELVRLWVKAMENDRGEITTHDRVGIFWALLLLSAQSKVELSQEEFYCTLKVRTIFGEELPPLPLGATLGMAAPPALDDN